MDHDELPTSDGRLVWEPDLGARRRRARGTPGHFFRFSAPVSTPQLYAIVCIDACERAGVEPLTWAAALCRSRPWALQLRAKSSSSRQTLEWLTQMRPLTRAAGTKLFCNDRPDLAALAGADGVHLGQDDVPLDVVRRHFPQLEVGLSTHCEEQLTQALAARPDYVALGPLFGTSSKVNHECPVGLAELRRLSGLARAAEIPLVSIGGIDEASLSQVLEVSDHVALISALLTPAEGQALLREEPASEVGAWASQRIGALFSDR